MVGCSFPPYGISIIKLNCFPLLNTVLLVYSGLFLMNCLRYLKKGYYRHSLINMFLTIIFGVFFILVQFIEYVESLFSFNDSCYGSVFFLLTGFHGFHVIIGLIFLIICFFRLIITYKVFNKVPLNPSRINKFILYNFCIASLIGYTCIGERVSILQKTYNLDINYNINYIILILVRLEIFFFFIKRKLEFKNNKNKTKLVRYADNLFFLGF